MNNFKNNPRNILKQLTMILMMVGVSFGLLLAGGQSAAAQAALDGFNPNADGTVYAVAVQPDGKIIIGGDFTSVLGTARNRIARLNPDGTLDTGFNANANPNGTVRSIAIQSDGKILVGGQFLSIGGQTRFNIARLNTDGTADSFDPSASVGGAVFSIAVQPDGKILVGGAFSSIGGQARNRIARLNTDGTADSFNPNSNDTVESIALQSDGKILVGGGFTSIGGQARNLFARLSNDTAAFSSLSVSQSEVTLTREGSAAQFTRVVFEQSVDDGANWTTLGQATNSFASSAVYTLTGLNLPTGQNILIRARGYFRAGYFNGSETIEDKVQTAFLQATDTTPPVITPTISGTLGNNGWYVSDVQVSWNVVDAESTVSSQSGCDTVNITADINDTIFTCQATSAGGTNSQSVTVKRDASAPSITFDSRTPAANAAGWNNSDVQVNWTCADALSGAVASSVSQTVNTEGMNLSAIGTCIDNAGNTAQDTQTGIKIDKTAPSITFASRTPANSNGWNNTDVIVNWNCLDSLSGVVNASVNQTVGGEGSILSAVGTCSDLAGNTASDTQSGISIDKTAPSLAPVVTPNPVNLNGSATASPNATDGLSGVASQSCAAVSTSSVGNKTVGCTATDNAGNTANADAAYQVVNPNVYNFTGFFQPVDNLPLVNILNAGQAVPIKFSLGGYQGLNILAAGYPISSPIACDASAPGDVIEETVNAGGSSLSYDAVTDRYTYVWKTNKAWKGACRMFVLKLSDGSEHYAKFRFR